MYTTTTVRFSITTSSKKVAPDDCDNDRQPEVAIRPPISGGTVIVSVEISTMTSSRKCSQVIAITTNYGTVLQYCFRLRIASVHVSMQSRQMPKRHFCLFVTVTKCADEKENCHSLSVCGAIQIQCRQSYKYIRARHPYCYFQLLAVVRIIWGTFFELATVENSRFAVEISTPSIIVPEI